MEYAHDICMVEDTYYVDMKEMRVPENEQFKKDNQVYYYAVYSTLKSWK